jgi:hypothetical protein
MKTRMLVSAAVALFAVFVGGCYESLTSIVTPDKVYFDPDLPGDYAATDPTAGRITIARGDDKGYTYKHYDEKGELKMKGPLHLVKLGNETFYQFASDGYATTEGKPVYAIGRIVIEGKAGAKSFTGYSFKTKEQLFDAVGVATAEYTHKENGEEKRDRALSMSTEALQAYLAAHGGEMTEAVLKYQQTAGK